MFRMLSKQSAISDEGIRVSSNGRHGIRYEDGDRVLLLNAEGIRTDSGQFGDLIYLARAARWQPPYEGQAIDAAHWQRIEAHLRQAFAVLGTPLLIEYC